MMGDPAANIFLIGPMGSGKTSIGQRVAVLLGLEFFDCDHELEKQTGASVSLIFDVEGEEGFRTRETKMLDELTARAGVLVATGGGVVLRPENRRLLRERGTVVYLSTPVTQQLRRLARDRSRPLLQSGDRRKKLEAMALQRNPLYQEIADLEFPAQNRALDSVARHLAEIIQNHVNSE